jgi:very-short-patch-repair endonuclease
VVARRQLLELGFSRQAIERRVAAGNLVVLHRGVYAVGHTALSPRGRQLAAVLSCGPGAMLSHRSAADLWGLLRSGASRIEVTAARGRKPRSGVTVHRPRAIHPDDRATRENIPVTSVARTLIDLADVLDDRRLQRAINEAELRNLFNLVALDRARARTENRRGRGRLERVLVDYREERDWTRSEGERRLLALCERHGLPKPSANTTVAGYEVDAHWADAAVVIEFDGVATHGTTRAFHEDRRRDRALAAAGQLVARVTARDLDDEAALAAQLRRIRGHRR